MNSGFVRHVGRMQATHSSSPRSLAIKTVVILCVAFAIALLLGERLADVQLSEVWAAMGSIPAESIALALLFGAISHLGLAGYDLLALPRIARRMPWPRAISGGFVGTVMSQVLGFGLITGSFARARIYRANEIRPTEAVALSGLAAAGFFSGLGMLLAILTLMDPGPAVAITGIDAMMVRFLAFSGVGLAVGAGVLMAGTKLNIPWAKLVLHVPDVRWLTRATGLAIADLVPAAFCLVMLLPHEGMPGYAAFVAIYISALALGHLIGSPGAVGPFEGILFLALPNMGAGELAAGILMYRLVYYLPAFAVALVLLAAAKRKRKAELLQGSALRDRVAWVVDGTANAEAELAWLGDKHIYFPVQSDAFVSYGISGRTWLIMGDPIGPRDSWSSLIDGFESEAKAAGAIVAIYKVTAQARSFWAERGWVLQPLGEEGSIALAGWTLDGRERRELRRKSRGIDKLGIVVRRHLPNELPVEAAAGIAGSWKTEKSGQEQTFSMGHWDPRFAARHFATTAWDGERLIAFATFWVSGDGREWMLDLMRQGPDAPNGTMHRLIVEAADMAAHEGAQQFNLCMAPLSSLEHYEPVTMFSRLGSYLCAKYNHRHGLQGLRRFKEIFRPDWAPRYLALRSWSHMPEALFAARQLVGGAGDPQAQETDRSPVLMLPKVWPELADPDSDVDRHEVGDYDPQQSPLSVGAR
ncbi:MAG: bifunctional lysylphosphatidylglycerol flippase/synthetase MprF [Paracoccaceae bacterium]